MVAYIPALIFIICPVIITVIAYRAKKGKFNNVREHYASQVVSLLVVLGGDTIAAIVSGYSFWDVVAALIGVDISEPAAVTIVSRILAVLIFVICCKVVFSIYQSWNGPVSRRQHQMSANKADIFDMLYDSVVFLAAKFEENSDLKVYRPISNLIGLDSNEVGNELPWHLEFARIYSIMSNQAHIDPTEDWHPQQHCFISTYASTYKLAIYCVSNMPNRDELEQFAAYICQFQTSYFKVIIAVKEGQREDFKITRGEQTIEYIFKCNALRNLVDFTDYYRSIDALYGQPLMDHTDVCLEDIYVDPDCCLEVSGEKFALSLYVDRWLKESGSRQLALLGDFGQGKTMFSIHLTHQLIHAHYERIPILIPLRNKSPRNSNPVEILSYFAAQYGIAPEALSILNANGKLLLIFDGFDEMDLVGNDDIRKRHFRSLWKLVLPKSKVLITGRPNYFLSRSEMASALGFQPDSSNAPYCEGLCLQPFRPEQIALSLRSAKDSVRNGIQYIMETKPSSSFLDLISRPSHLFLVSQIWETRRLEQKYQNLTSAIIINEFLQDCFERQAAKGGRNPYFYLSSIEREYFMVGIAARMYKMGVTSITNDSFQIAIQELLELFPEEISAETSVFINIRNGKSVREFANSDENSLLAIVNDVRTCGIMVNDTVNDGLCFAHKSFFDVLAAKFFLGKNLEAKSNLKTISTALARSSNYNPRLKNDVVVRKLLAELLAAQIDVCADHCDNRTQCRRIFESCRKAISFPGFRRTPQVLFQHCIQYSENPAADFSVMRWQHQKQSRRLLFVCILPAIISVLFIGMGLRFGQYKDDAVLYYSGLSTPDPPASSEVEPPVRSWSGSLVILLCVGFFVVLYFVSNRLSLAFREKSELILLTWYYACKESQIPDTVIFQQFSKGYAEVFADYVQGKDLTELQDLLEQSRGKSAGIRRKRL